MQPFEIVHNVQSRFRGIAGKLAGITGKCSEWFLSHGREPRSQNPLQSGNLSAVDAFMTYCRQYEACETGAGQMLVDHVGAVLTAEFSPRMHVSLADAYKEGSEAIQSDIENKPIRIKEREYAEAIVTFSHRLQELKEEILPQEILPPSVKAAARARSGTRV